MHHWVQKLVLHVAIASMGTEVNATSDKLCNLDTGGTCSFFGCHGSRNSVCDPNGKCVCKPYMECAVDGVCKANPKEQEKACTKAYKDGCVHEKPYYGMTINSCCGKCSLAYSQYRCSWRFEELAPCATTPFSIHGSFVYDATDKDCAHACDEFNNPNHSRQLFCKNTDRAAVNPIGNCPVAVLAAKKICEWTPQKATSSIKASWTHIRGEIEGENCGDYKKVTDRISGSFSYPSEDHGGHCFKAAKALGNKNLPSEEFCNGSSVESAVMDCESAKTSLDNSNVKDKWCHTNTQTKEASPTPSPKQVQDVCNEAFRKGCWKGGDFRKCCRNCVADNGHATCQWRFTGAPEYEGNKCIHAGQDYSGKFHAATEACVNACQDLSRNIQTVEELCQARNQSTTSSIAQRLQMCPGAVTSIVTAFGTDHPCGQPLSSEELPLVLVAEDDELCKEAYDARCYEQDPFKECCNTCSDGSLELRCNWKFKEDATIKQDLIVDWEDSFVDCSDVCPRFDKASNTRCAYCPGGEVYDYAKQRNCNGAIESMNRQTNGICSTICNCDSPDVTQHVTCTWTHYAGETTGSVCPKSNRVVTKQTRTFKYDGSQIACAEACVALGSKTISPAEFCDLNGKLAAVEKCDAAKKSLQDIKPPPEWCEAKNRNTPPDHASDGQVARANSVCEDAYRQGCWNTGAFQGCCGRCNANVGSATCEWKFQASFGGRCEPIAGSFLMGDDADCYQACKTLSDEMKETGDFCLDNSKRMKIDKCLAAKGSVEKVLPSGWCPHHVNFMANFTALAASPDPAVCKAAYESRCFDVAPFKSCCASCSDGTSSQTCIWRYDFHGIHIKGQFTFVGASSVCCDVLRTSATPQDFCPNGKVRKACEDQDFSGVTWCEKAKDAAALTCEWRYSYDSHSKDKHASLTGEIKDTFVVGDSTECQKACVEFGQTNNLPSAYCRGTRTWGIIQKCKLAAESLQRAQQRDEALKDRWCKSLKWDVAKEISESGKKQECKDDRVPHWANVTNQVYKCWNLTNGDSGGQAENGRKAFDQCCSNCLDIKASNWCTWTVRNPLKHTKIESNKHFADGDIQCQKRGCLSFGTDMPIQGDSECFDACTDIKSVSKAEDICPPYDATNYTGGSVWTSNNMKVCPNGLRSLALNMDRYCQENGKSWCYKTFTDPKTGLRILPRDGKCPDLTQYTR